jgi:ABC-type Zn2+ transport system substrate-binding protein/surface adhesin
MKFDMEKAKKKSQQHVENAKLICPWITSELDAFIQKVVREMQKSEDDAGQVIAVESVDKVCRTLGMMMALGGTTEHAEAEKLLLEHVFNTVLGCYNDFKTELKKAAEIECDCHKCVERRKLERKEWN